MVPMKKRGEIDAKTLSVLIVNGEPVFHTEGNRSALGEYLLENYGLFSDAGGWCSSIDTVDELAAVLSISGGLESRPEYDLLDGNGEPIHFIIMISPGYMWSLKDYFLYVFDDEDGEVVEKVRDYYLDLGVDPDNY